MLIYTFAYYFKKFSQTYSFLIALVLVIVLYLTLLGHEFSHALVARRIGVGCKKIVLFILGAAAFLERNPKNPSEEIKVAIAGPLASLLIGLSFFLIKGLIYEKILFEFVKIISNLNLIWAGFNLIPAFPMDGGRIYRSILWKITNEKVSSTYIATFVGFSILISLTFIFKNFWLLFITVFILFAGLSECRTVSIENKIRKNLENVKVKDMMSKIDPPIEINNKNEKNYFCSPDEDVLKILTEIIQEKLFWVKENNRIIGKIGFFELLKYFREKQIKI
jgi:Zn-dependent protease